MKSRKLYQPAKKIILASFISLLLFISSCTNNYTPKPYGYFRVDLPHHSYRTIDTLNLPYTFCISSHAQLIDRSTKENKFWIDIRYPSINAIVYCSYKPINNNLIDLLEDTRKIVYKHTVRADGINEQVYEQKDKHVFGLLYDLKGNTASTLQFVLTDSSKHFFRGALYFENVPNKDSIAPMAEFVREDMIKLIESFNWKKNK